MTCSYEKGLEYYHLIGNDLLNPWATCAPSFAKVFAKVVFYDTKRYYLSSGHKSSCMALAVWCRVF